MKHLIRMSALVLTSVILAACGSNSSTSSTSSGGGSGGGSGGLTGQTAAELAQAGYLCATDSTLGSTLGSNGMVHQMVLQSDSTFLYSVVLYNGSSTGCATSVNSNGGTELGVYTLTGTYTVNGGVTASGVTATEVAYTISTASVQLQSNSDSEKTELATWLATCTGISFSAASTQPQSVLGGVCASSGGFSALTMPTSGGVFYNLGYNTGSVLEIGARVDMWRPGTTSYPSSLTETYQQ